MRENSVFPDFKMLVCAAALAACGGSESVAGDAGADAPRDVPRIDLDAARMAPACSYTFQADVRSGPSAGYALRGQLTLVQGASGAAAGVLVPDGVPANDRARLVMVTAAVASGSITMRFTLPDGRLVVGTGPFAGFSMCPGDVVGTLTGPSAGDMGDWRTIYIPLSYGCAFCLGYCMANGSSNSTCGDACTFGGQC